MIRLAMAVAAVALLSGVAQRPAAAVVPSVAVAEGFRYVPGGDGESAPLRVVQGGSLLFVNADTLAPHTLTSRIEVSDGEFLFSTGDTEVQSGDARIVDGVEKLSPGTYQFFCRLHSWFMTGELEVVTP